MEEEKKEIDNDSKCVVCQKNKKCYLCFDRCFIPKVQKHGVKKRNTKVEIK